MAPKGRDPRAKEPSNRPGWKGPAYIKKQTQKPKPTEKKVTSDKSPANPIPLELQQLLLNIFSNAFADLLKSEKFPATLQEVKQALFERDFERAFGREEFLQSYAARYSPSRALCYAQILVDMKEHFGQSSPRLNEKLGAVSKRKLDVGRIEVSKHGFTNPAMKVVCFGGGAAEVVAFGGLLAYFNPRMSNSPSSSKEEEILEKALQNLTTSDEARESQIKLGLVDTAAWGEVILNLSNGLKTPPPLSKYASTTAKANNTSLLSPDLLQVAFHQVNALNLTQPEISSLLSAGEKDQPTLITLLFTLNELYSSSLPKTTTFLLHLTTTAKTGTLLLVVDSPGSYSETAIGKDSKKYPMQWLLDHTLLEKAKLADGEEGAKAAWEKLVEEDSEWFRLGEKLRFPIVLEDMRYQIHLYRRV